MDEKMTVADMLAATFELAESCQTACAISIQGSDSMIAFLMAAMERCVSDFEQVVRVAQNHKQKLSQTHIEQLRDGSKHRYNLMLQTLADLQMVCKNGAWVAAINAKIDALKLKTMVSSFELDDFTALIVAIVNAKQSQDGQTVDLSEFSTTDSQRMTYLTRMKKGSFRSPEEWRPVRTVPAPPSLYKNKLAAQEDRQLESCESDWVNSNLLKTWLQRCDHAHQDHCRLSLAEAKVFDSRPHWLIDVQKACLVSGEGAEEYVTLSYVWGKAEKRFLARKSILPDMLIDGYFTRDDIRKQIPRTLIDSMTLTLQLEQQYLWIDCLCIIQDDDVHRTQQIGAMASIYVNSELTIVAIGHGADLGLHGVGSPFEKSSAETSSEPPSYHEVIKRRYEEVVKSPWSTRGWTFQEQILSRRVMVFTEKNVTWECHCAVWMEGMDPIDEQCGTFDSVVSAGSALISRPSLEEYGRHVRVYNRRQLSDPDDTARAFAGILTTLGSKFEGGFICGLPASHLDTALLWRNVLCGQPRALKSSKIRGRYVLPSWSWMHWSVDLILDMWTEERHRELVPLVSWKYKVNLGQPWKSIGRFTDDDETAENHNSDLAVLPAWDIHDCPLYLYTRAERAFFTIRRQSTTNDYAGLHETHLDNLPRPSAIYRLSTFDGAPAGVLISASSRILTQCEIVAISQTTMPMPLKEGSVRTESTSADGPTLGGANGQEPEVVQYYNVLWISWWKGIAYRRGMGQVLKSVWEQEREAGEVEMIDLVLG